MTRKNGMTGAIPGAGRPKTDYVKKNINITSEADIILKDLPAGYTIAAWVSEAIIEKKSKENTSPLK